MPPQPGRRQVQPQREPRHQLLYAPRIAAVGDDRRAHASGSGPPPLARHGQNDPPFAIGRSNWMFAGSLRAGQRAAAVMSLIQSAKLNGHDPYAYLKDVLARLPTQKNSQIEELLPHRWQSTPL